MITLDLSRNKLRSLSGTERLTKLEKLIIEQSFVAGVQDRSIIGSEARTVWKTCESAFLDLRQNQVAHQSTFSQFVSEAIRLFDN
jgi:hypothetical protein